MRAAKYTMKVLIQRVTHASVTIDGQVEGEISAGLLLLIGIDKQDTEESVGKMVEKVLAYRVFADDEGKMNLSVSDTGGGILAISQFTLAANTQKGLRPSFSSAAPPAAAEALYDHFVRLLRERHSVVATGRFGADMKVSLLNDGPVTFLLEM